jgi:hypothetical protein
MTSFESFPTRNRDAQDGVERHVFGEIFFDKDNGAYLTVRGNGTEDEEVPVINIGIGQAFKKNTNTEVLLFASGSDTGLKFGLITIPRNKQRQWKEGASGVQNAEDPEKALEFNQKRAWITDNLAVLAGMLEVKDGEVFIRGTLKAQQVEAGNFVGPIPSGSMSPIPPFEE